MQYRSINFEMENWNVEKYQHKTVPRKTCQLIEKNQLWGSIEGCHKPLLNGVVGVVGVDGVFTIISPSYPLSSILRECLFSLPSAHAPCSECPFCFTSNSCLKSAKTNELIIIKNQ